MNIHGRVWLIGSLFWIFCGYFVTLSAQDIGNTINQFYHNTAAQYNALFIARAEQKKIISTLREQEQPSYEEAMSVYLEYDSTQTTTLTETIDNCIKKSSLVIQYHPKSKWIDEAYLLLGQAWHYAGEPLEAVKAYQYLERHAQQPAMKHAAQVALLRTYVQEGQLDEATALAHYIARNPPRKGPNRLHYLLGLAYLAQHIDRKKEMLNYLQHALPMVKSRYRKNRLYFIMAQTYEALGNDELARQQYKKCTKSLLPYRFYLEATLRSWACTNVETPRATKKMRKRFKKQLREEKNQPFLYHIFYHWARWEQKEEQKEEAQQHYLASARLNSENPLIRGRSYEAVAEMFYKDEEMLAASTYYDSAANSLPEHAKGFAAIKQLAEVLKRLAGHYKVKQEQDSLLRLSTLSEDELSAFLDQRQAEEQTRLKEENKRAAEAAVAEKNRLNTTQNNPTRSLSNKLNATEGQNWYFYNPTQIRNGQQLFKKTWGQIPLTDNWRQGGGATFLAHHGTDPQNTSDNADTTNEKPTTAADTVVVSIESLRADIPQDEESKQSAIRKLTDAYYGIGKIYYFELEQQEKGLKAFLELIDRFPESIYTARLLYLLAQEERQSSKARIDWALRLRKEYADSIYVKLLDNPNYLIEQSAAVRALQSTYKKAYEAYKKGDYPSARDSLDHILNEQSESNSFTDNATLLDILIDAEIGMHHIYQYRLQTFMGIFPKSELNEEIKERIESAEAIQKRKKYSSLPEYKRIDHAAPHAIIWTAHQRAVLDSLSAWLPEYLSNISAPMGIILLDTDLWVLLIPNFSNGSAAMKHLDIYAKSDLTQRLSQHFPNTEIQGLAIDEENLLTVFTVKEVALYSQFFKTHYSP